MDLKSGNDEIYRRTREKTNHMLTILQGSHVY